MDYNQISGFLDKFKKILFQKEEIYKIISKTILKHTHVYLDPSLIKIKNSSIYIESSPIIRSEILVFKNKILLDLKKEIPDTKFFDIK
jgi:hypothetical protein